MTRTLLIDRDGVLNVDRVDHVRSPEELVVLPTACQALLELEARGFHVLVITNQSGIARGFFSTATLDAIHAKLLRELGEAARVLAGFYVCPHRPEDGCGCRKPLPGLITKAQAEWGFAPADTWMVGDTLRDLQAAHAAGCKAAFVKTGQGVAGPLPPGVPIYDDLLAFAKALGGY